MGDTRQGRKGGLFCDFETEYGTEVPLSTDNYQLLRKPPVLSETWLNEGETFPHSISAAPRKRTRKSGKGATFPFEIWVRGRSDLSAGPPLDVHHLLVASGLRAWQPDQPRTWAYEAWIPQDLRSLTCNLYAHDQKHILTGCYVPSWEMKAAAGGMLELTGTGIGVHKGTEDAESPVPLEFDANTTLPVKFDGLGVPVGSSVGNWKPVVRSFSLRYDREYATRRDGNADGALIGYQLGRLNPAPTLTLEVEAVDLNVFNPHIAMAMQDKMKVVQSFVTGDQWWYIVAEEAQLVKVAYSGSAGTYWTLVFQLRNRSFARSSFWLWCSQINPNPTP